MWTRVSPRSRSNFSAVVRSISCRASLVRRAWHTSVWSGLAYAVPEQNEQTGPVSDLVIDEHRGERVCVVASRVHRQLVQDASEVVGQDQVVAEELCSGGVEVVVLAHEGDALHPKHVDDGLECEVVGRVGGDHARVEIL